MDKLKEIWAKITEKVGNDVALAVVAGVAVAVLVHPVAGIVVGGGLYLFKTGKLKAWLDKD